MKTKEITKGYSLSGAEETPLEIIEFIGVGFDFAHPPFLAKFLIA
jgi:hypothetical protein